MAKDLLDDDFEWENINDDLDELETSEPRQSVVMIRTFNTEEQAHLTAATLRADGIDAHVVSAATGQLTPFAYGNVRLFVAESQVLQAENILKDLVVREEVYSTPSLSAARILIILVAGIFIMGLFLRLLLILIGYF